ncbi:MAG: DNA polymerase IV, partial [Caldilineae bacterium]
AKSISQETTFSRDVNDPQVLQETLQQMSHRLANRLQKRNISARTVTLKLRYSDFSTHTRQITLDAPTRDAETIYRRGVHLLRAHWRSPRSLRLIGLGVSHFVAGVEQKSFFEGGSSPRAETPG